jgi:hypothetical protein
VRCRLVVMLSLVGVLLGLPLAACTNRDTSVTRAAPFGVSTRAYALAKPAPQRVFFVAVWGRDRAPGTETRPWRTIAHALTMLHAGDALYIRGGYYSERIDVRLAPGTPHARIWVGAYPGEHPVILGQLWIGEARYFTLSGITVTEGARSRNAPMVRLYGGTDWTLYGNAFFGARATSALHIDDGPNDDLGRWRVIDNCIHDTVPTNGGGQDNNVYVDDMSASSTPRGVIVGNVIFGAPNGRGIKLGPGGTHGGPRDVLVRNNTLYGQMENISLSRGTAHVVVTRNILADASSGNVGVYHLLGSHDIVIDNLADATPRLVSRVGHGDVALAGNQFPVPLQVTSVSCAGLRAAGWPGYGAHG